MSVFRQQQKSAPVLGENWFHSLQLIEDKRPRRETKAPERFDPSQSKEKRRKCPNGDCGECEDCQKKSKGAYDGLKVSVKFKQDNKWYSGRAVYADVKGENRYRVYYDDENTYDDYIMTEQNKGKDWKPISTADDLKESFGKLDLRSQQRDDMKEMQVDNKQKINNECSTCNEIEQCLIKRNNMSKKEMNKHTSREFDTKPPSYVFGTSWERQDQVSWLEKHAERAVCVLSVHLFQMKKEKGTAKYNFEREKYVSNAINDWTRHGWVVLLFVPAGNSEEYSVCLNAEDRWPNTVKIVPYMIPQSPCNGRMLVGESRNAILAFVSHFKRFFATCTIADERVWRIHTPILPKDDTLEDQWRVAEGYARLMAVKQWMGGNRDRTAFHNLVVEHEWEATGKNRRLLDQTSTSAIFEALQGLRPSLISVSDRGRNRNRNMNLNLPFAEHQHAVLAQLITFAVGGEVGWKCGEANRHRWHGQFWYTYTTAGEDMSWSYQWSKKIGRVDELTAVQAERQGLRKSQETTLTRGLQDLSTYTKCGLMAWVDLLQQDWIRCSENDIYMLWHIDYEPNYLKLIETCADDKRKFYHIAKLVAELPFFLRKHRLGVPSKIKRMAKIVQTAFKKDKEKKKQLKDTAERRAVLFPRERKAPKVFSPS